MNSAEGRPSRDWIHCFIPRTNIHETQYCRRIRPRKVLHVHWFPACNLYRCLMWAHISSAAIFVATTTPAARSLTGSSNAQSGFLITADKNRWAMYSLERRSKFCTFSELHSNIRNNPNFDSFDFVLFGIDQVTATVTLPWNVPRRLKLVFRSA